MSFESQLLDRIKVEQQNYALEALMRPQARDAFEYGYRAGTVAGLEAAIEILITLNNENKYGDHDI